MNTIKILIKRLHPDAIIPVYKKRGDAGFDLHNIEDITVMPGTVAVIRTGLAFAIPQGYEMQIRMRSGASLTTPLILANAPGTIDSGYRGEIGIIVRNIGKEAYLVQKGERLAQGVIAPIIHANFIESDILPESERNAHGFGSTGKS